MIRTAAVMFYLAIALSDSFKGMLASAETVDVVADALRRHGSPLSVMDPV